MSVAVVTFKISDFFTHLSSVFGQDLDFQWEPFECWSYDEDNIGEARKHFGL